MSIELLMLSYHLILCFPLLLTFSVFPNNKVFSNKSGLCIRWPKVGTSASASVLPMNNQGRFPLRLTVLMSLQSKALKSLLHKHNSKASSSVLSFHYSPTLTSIHDKWKNHSFDKTDLCRQSKVLPFNMLSTLVITFLPMSKHLLISWLQSQSTITLKPPKLKFVTASTVSPSICHEVMGTDALIFVF